MRAAGPPFSLMGTTDWYWERGRGGVSRFVPAGDLDYDTFADFAAALGAVPPEAPPIIDIDLRCVTFLDASTACLLARYQAAACRLGKQVRIVNAVGIPRLVLAAIGMLPPDGVTRPGPSVGARVLRE